MTNFVFFYTLFKNFDYAFASMQRNSDFTEQFLIFAKKMCELEAQTFLSEESKEELEKIRTKIQNLIQNVSHLQLDTFHQTYIQNLTHREWRIFIGFMCTFHEWCEETRFFQLSSERQKFIFSENPIDGPRGHGWPEAADFHGWLPPGMTMEGK